MLHMIWIILHVPKFVFNIQFISSIRNMDDTQAILDEMFTTIWVFGERLKGTYYALHSLNLTPGRPNRCPDYGSFRMRDPSLRVDA